VQVSPLVLKKSSSFGMALPESQEFTVSYSLTADSEATGNKAISGTFSYIKTNQRVDYELPTKIIEVRGEAAVAQKQKCF